MALDEVRTLAVIGKAAFSDGDSLNDRDAAGGEAGAKFAEISGPIMFANRLDHLDRSNSIETPVNVSIVEKLEVGAAVRSVAGKSRFGVGKLFGGERYAAYG